MLKRTAKEFKADNLTDLAAALTYYGVLAIFPALIVIVSILGLLGHSVTGSLVNNLAKLAPGPARTSSPAPCTTSSRGGGPPAYFHGRALLALWSASGYIAAFMRASNIV